MPTASRASASTNWTPRPNAVFVNPYESSGDAWPTTFARLVWGVVLLQIFMTGLFAARQSVVASTGMIPLLLGTIAWSYTMREDFKGLSQHTPLASIAAADHAVSPVASRQVTMSTSIRLLTIGRLCSGWLSRKPMTTTQSRSGMASSKGRTFTLNTSWRKSFPSLGSWIESSEGRGQRRETIIYIPHE
jgi:hypothetical protein